MSFDELEELESYSLFQDINDTFTILSGVVSQDTRGLLIKDTFIITTDDKILLNDTKTNTDKEMVIKWLNNIQLDLLEKIYTCIKLTDEIFLKFKSQNPEIKEEIKTRANDLKRALRFLDSLSFDTLTYESFYNLKKGPKFDSDYAGISVKETKYYLI